MLGRFCEAVPFLLAENHTADGSGVTSRLVEETSRRMMELLTRFVVCLDGETPTPMVVRRASQTVVTVFGEHGVQYQRGLRIAVAQEEAAIKAAEDVARLGAEIELATEPRLADLEEELARVRARGLNLSECVRRWTALQARRSILTAYYADR
jgi:hypothetical protein